MSSRDRGFTLAELLVAIVLAALVGQSMVRLVTVSQRLFRAQSERAALQATVRAGAMLLPAELRELSGEDLLAIAPDQLVYRAMRLTAVACRISATAVTLRRRLIYAYRSLSPGRDTLLVFAGSGSGPASDRWLTVPLTGPASAAVCPDGDAAVEWPAVVPPAAVSAAEGIPVRGFEVMQLRLYASTGQYWIGSRSVSGGEAQVQPAIGPLSSNGLEFGFRRLDGTTTTSAAEVAFVDLTVRGQTDGAITGGGGTVAVRADSVVAGVELRNAE
jgi:prepilin-type N-terminal cleavage/methylation domain-containing protein